MRDLRAFVRAQTPRPAVPKPHGNGGPSPRKREGTAVAVHLHMRPVLVSDVMTTPVVTFFEEQTLPLADDVMRFEHLVTCR